MEELYIIEAFSKRLNKWKSFSDRYYKTEKEVMYDVSLLRRKLPMDNFRVRKFLIDSSYLS